MIIHSITKITLMATVVSFAFGSTVSLHRGQLYYSLRARLGWADDNEERKTMIIQQGMTMKLLFSSLLMSVLLLNVSKCFGAEYIVQPGSNTIAAAISAASSGDTLVLQAGSFVGDVSIDKSLTVRAISASTNSVVEGLFEINGPGIEVTIQGLKISNSLSVVQGGAVNILQNELVVGDIDVTQYATSAGAGTLVIIGNRLNKGYIRTVNSENAYIAGNVLTEGAVVVNASAWVIGNDISREFESSH